MAHFYYLPKVHKNATNPPVHPIIAGIGFLTSGLSKYVDLQPQNYVVQLQSYLRDTTSVIKEVTKLEWHHSYKWATLDVVPSATLV